MSNRRRVMASLNEHAYVDFGLPSGTLWATMNVGATSETDYGNYYKYGSGATAGSIDDTYYSGDEDPLAVTADTATQVWGSPWHMPTIEQLGELMDYVGGQWTSINGVSGVKFAKKGDTDTSKYIFFPAAGLCTYSSPYNVGSACYYWSSSPYYSDDNLYAYLLILYIGCDREINAHSRFARYSVRPVIG